MVLVIHCIHNVYHISLPYFWYIAFGGVELFFALSGFLIGRILIQLFNKTEVGIREVANFWTRRWLRTLPLYYILYFIYLGVYNLFIDPRAFNWKYLFFLQNIVEKPVGLLGESWSLSIEEWFYLFLPALIFVVHHVTRIIAPIGIKKNYPFLFSAIIVIIGMNIFRSIIINKTQLDDHAVMFRLDACAYGLIAAYVSTRIQSMNNKKAFYLGCTGLLFWLIAAIINIKPDSFGLELLYYPLCGIGTSISVLSLFYFSFTTQYSFIQYTSKISYSIYLVHLTAILIPFRKHIPPNEPLISSLILIPLIVLIFIVSSITYRFIEQPFLRWREIKYPK